MKKIGFWSLTSLVVGNLVGAGVFMLPANLASFQGMSLLGLGVASFGAMLLAMIFSKLSAKLPFTGGPYVYVREAFGDMMGFFTCWGYWLMAWISNCVLAVAIVSYLLPFFPECHSYTLHFELLSIIVLTLVNLFSVNVSAKCELWITIFKVIPLLVLPLIAIFSIDLSYFKLDQEVQSFEFWNSLNTVAFLAFWGFIGLETGTVPGGQVEKPIRNIPRAVMAGTFIAMVIYVLGMVASIGIIPVAELSVSKAPYADIANVVFGGNWGRAVSIIAIISIIGTLHGWILVVGQIPLGAVKDGLFPKVFGKINKFGSPYAGVLISSICTCAFVIFSHHESLVSQFQFIIEISITIIFIIYFLCVVSYWKIIRRDRRLSGSENLLVLSSILFILWAMWSVSFKMVALSSFGFIAGIPFYLWVGRSKNQA